MYLYLKNFNERKKVKNLFEAITMNKNQRFLEVEVLSAELINAGL